MLAPTCAHTCIVAYMVLYTIVWHIFLYTRTHTRTHTHTHTHVQRTCTHQFYMWQTIHLSDDGTNTLHHKHCHMHMYSIQFNCTCACQYRPLILCKFVYQAFYTCIVFQGLNTLCPHLILLHTCTHTPLYNVAMHMQKRSHNI